MQGVPVTRTAHVGRSRGQRPDPRSNRRLADAASTSHGSTAADGRVGFAPFVVRPRSLGEHRVAVVLPTLTWQAYNLRDDDGDGKGDSWYARLGHTDRRGSAARS